ncbi:MAG: paraquat-inducible protein A [Gammaproteobacteria bacterium]|nr:paraquat-inducible protein A [Gammaproteobacteria bacterium]MCP5318037.1 paraquat-inducible protein A [Chromatiaceae bacterium]MCW5584722.1 paraquat-inducible protein A [Chromatiales bacterium]MCB1817709.1 paraquat-inducible protein A [Gammaproteobacteria bacterium]MCP5435363.1 paraquat-inducible protein A [Chromatiaceae bacterium]
MNRPAITANARGLVACHVCGLVSRPAAALPMRCPRCDAPLHDRIPRSLSRTWAFLVAAMMLYLPANLLPIMHVTQLGRLRSDTILSGTEYLLAHGMWPLALIVFVASVLIPLAKIAILVVLLLSVQLHAQARPMDRLRLYRFTEFVGRWSMVDVFVVTVLVALVHLGQVAEIEAGLGAAFFAGVVVLTMLAAKTFDPRLIWDNVSYDVEPNAN